ncbi:MAG: malonate transporter subunit MadL [Flavobacteriaceae bacterium]|nr:malonate transporter subunit MadL [Flavobacteriaceae bacterium]
MNIYGVSLLAFCFLFGKIIGTYLGSLIGLSGDVGGVGFSMFFLVFINSYLKKKNINISKSENGILFWSTMYIPIVVAMSASQNVKAAMLGGWLAVIAGVLVTIVAFILVPLISRISKEDLSKNISK